MEESVDHIGDDGRDGFISQETIHSSFQNHSDGYRRVGYRSHNIHSPFHNPGVVDRLLGFSIHGDERSVHESQTIHLTSH